ncbi:MAG: glycerophosphodiester phosphodiesterase family protein [Planctomycetia bacterium]|nr:glycerophosphodiester phosphodiesterase family protein [Planctomycetia bacterium]
MSLTTVMNRTRSTRSVGIALLCLLVSCAATLGAGTQCAHGQDAWNIREHIPRDKVVVMAHRGMGEEAPEGTMESFLAAWALGQAPEADIRTTKDGVVVSFHDDNFARIIPDAPDEIKRQGVQDVTLAELVKLDVGAYKGERFQGQRVATMTDIIAALQADKTRYIFCDLKNVDLPKFAEQTRDVWPQIYLTSSDYVVLKKWKELAPTSKTRLWTPRAWCEDETTFRRQIQNYLDQKLVDLDILEAHAKVDADGNLSPSRDAFTYIANQAREYGALFEVMPLTYGDKTFSYKSLLDAGVSALSSDYPTVVKHALDDYYQAPQRDANASQAN